MIWLAFPAMVILLVRLTIVLANFISWPFLKPAQAESKPLLSILIPARNEEGNLPLLLDGLLEHGTLRMEILIYNDESDDGTLEVITSYAMDHPHISLVPGKPLPVDWSGKNHACYQLAQHARGEYLLFLDADVRIRPVVFDRAISYMERHDLSLLSLFPKQLMNSLGELLTVPTMNWILLSLLPLSLIRRSHYPSLAAANGQFMLFRAREYRHHQFHRMVKGVHVEDIHIIRLMKRMGYSTQTLLSSGEVTCRMYKSYREGISGFTRSMFAFFGGSGLILLLFTIFSTFGVWFIWMGMSPVLAGVYLFLAAIMRTLIFVLSRQPVLLSLLLSPFIHGSFIWMVIQSFRLRSKGKNLWKGRSIAFKEV